MALCHTKLKLVIINRNFINDYQHSLTEFDPHWELHCCGFTQDNDKK